MQTSAARVPSSLSAAVLPWREPRLPVPSPVRLSASSGGHRLDLKGFLSILSAEGLRDRVPDLEERICALSRNARTLYGFSFTPSELRIPARDLPWLLSGLASGLTLRPLVLDSPRPEDIASLGLDPRQSMLAFRLDRLRASGMRILNSGASAALCTDLRWPDRDGLGERLGEDGLRWLPEVYESLPLPATLGGRAGARPRLIFVGRHGGPRRGPLLAATAGAAVRVEDPATYPTAATVLGSGCRLLTPEAALLLAGQPDLRDGDSSLLGCDGPVLLGALTPFARIATITSYESGIQLGTADPWRVHAADRLVAATG